MNEFVDAIRNNAGNAFRRRYREVDVLLVDDIQFLERSQQLQEEFFHTFNSLHGAGNQIVLSSDRPPKQIPRLEDRLRTRLEWGLITDVQPPEFETRLAILRMKAEAEALEELPDEVLNFIASNISDNVRQLEGALIRVAAYSSLNRLPLSEEVARQVLIDLLPPVVPRVITPELILDETAKMFGFTVEDLCGRSRRRPLVIARQIGMYVFRELTDFSYPKIAEEFGGRDHTTVIHAVEKIKGLMTERHNVFDQVNELMSRIRLGTRDQWISLWTPGDISRRAVGNFTDRSPARHRPGDAGGQVWDSRDAAPTRADAWLSTIHRTYYCYDKNTYRLRQEVDGEVPLRARHAGRGDQHRTAGGLGPERRAPGALGHPGHRGAGPHRAGRLRPGPHDPGAGAGPGRDRGPGRRAGEALRRADRRGSRPAS